MLWVIDYKRVNILKNSRGLRKRNPMLFLVREIFLRIPFKMQHIHNYIIIIIFRLSIFRLEKYYSGGLMLSINSIARVVVTASRSSAMPSAFDTGLLLAEDANFTDERRVQTYLSAQTAVTGLTDLGFAADSEAVLAVGKYFGAEPAPSRLLVSCYPSSETPAQALAVVLDLTSTFYGVCLGQAETRETILALSAAVDASSVPMVLFLPVTGTPAEAAAPSALLSALKASGTSRAIPLYCEEVSDAAALMGLAMGLELSHPDTAFALCYKSLQGLTPSDLTETQAEAIKALNGNVYLTRGYTHHLLEKGTAASGARYDEVLYLDRIAADLQNEAVALLAENPDRLPQTDDASAQFINRFAGILTGYTSMGVLASGAWKGSDAGPLRSGDVLDNGFALWADSYDTQSDEDRAAHKAMPIHAALILAGSLESVVIAVNVQI